MENMGLFVGWIKGGGGMRNKEELAAAMRNAGFWNLADCTELCAAAGMEKEWEAADGETFEVVLYKAAEKLGVEII